MKFLVIVLLSFTTTRGPGWLLDFNEAKSLAQKENKFILLNFSGSDWCGPCIRMEKDIFEDTTFKVLASKKLVLLNADFPRAKKNALSKTQQEKNDQLADRYNKQGIFPLTVLLTADGRVIRMWEGYPKISAVEFSKQIETLLDTGN